MSSPNPEPEQIGTERTSAKPARSPRPRRTRGSLAHADIVDAAERIIDGDGVGALTMRRLADELHVGVMTLYVHVRSKRDIVNLVATRQLGGVRIPALVDGNWQDFVRATYGAIRELYLEHPYIAEIHTSQASPPPPVYVLIEQIVEALEAAGFERDAAGEAHLALINYTLGAALFALPRDPGAGLSAELVSTLDALPRTEYPALRSMGLVLARGSSDEQFRLGLDLLIAGIEQRSGPDRAAAEDG